MKIGIAILTLNAKEDLPRCLPNLLKHSVLVVDSSSTDGTGDLALKMGANLLTIPKGSFNHGLTRETARKALGTDIVVMVTQDAFAADEWAVERLVEPLLQGKASLAYGRQLPKSLNPFEAFPRHFNYPDKGHIRSLKEAPLYGSFLNFFSDSFSAYLNCALDEIGGFPETLIGEDTLVCASLLLRGHSVAYVAESLVYHSHNYSPLQEFQRHFDIGLVRSKYRALLLPYGKDETRGRAFAGQFLSELKPHLLPKGLIHLMAKYTGYRLGMSAEKWPKSLKKLLSSQKFYWT